MKIQSPFIWAGILVSIFTGCVTVEQRGITKILEDPKVALKDVSLKRASLMELLLHVDLEVHNPNPLALTTKGGTYTVWVEGNRLVSGEIRKVTTIKPAGVTILPLSASIKTLDMPGTIKTLLSKRERLEYKVEGNLVFKTPIGVDLNVPYTYTVTKTSDKELREFKPGIPLPKF